MREKIPIVICIDVEPDTRTFPVGIKGPWRGQELTYDFFHSFRPHLASVTGEPARYVWFLRMDPQITEGYGAPDYFAVKYSHQVRYFKESGDEVGLHTHGWRWGGPSRGWIVDHGDQGWIDHCVRTSFETFRTALHEDCRSFRFGDRWMNNPTVELLERLGARYDLTLEPGHNEEPREWKKEVVTGQFLDYRKVPRSPYRPSRKDFRKSDPSRREGLWMIPVSTQGFRVPEASRRKRFKFLPSFVSRLKRPRTLRLGIPSGSFKNGVEFLLTSLEKPFLVLAVRSCVLLCPRRTKHMKESLDYLLSHPLARRFVFSTPPNLIGWLGGPQ